MAGSPPSSACAPRRPRAPASQEPAAELPARGPVRGVPPHYGNRRAKGLVRPRPSIGFYTNARPIRTTCAAFAAENSDRLPATEHLCAFAIAGVQQPGAVPLLVRCTTCRLG